jgi:DUF971 family protein
MQLLPVDIQLIGDELAIRWNDEAESYLPLQNLRLACPCAACQGEPDALGHIERPLVSYDPERSFRLRSYAVIGGYAFQPTWEDGHSTGLYTFSSLRHLGAAHETPSSAA